ncbi:hypothetical protein LEP1GSC047_4071 [Leptospira inadai serovar Lyme str. 10]|uniref:Uncharacterized protein n=1 Tax=Leptospira inadai serovar Lyme str. 10 TaxID=1049790 RepID=V6HYL4_9LEPT|nr:hypothetical protein LEP1GSC047_4071 [Leptospira inadai serovar Lyme str. 10]
MPEVLVCKDMMFDSSRFGKNLKVSRVNICVTRVPVRNETLSFAFAQEHL